LKSGVNLHLQSGATIRFSRQPAHYLPVVFTRFEGTELLNYSPLVYALDQENVAVTGAGTLDGQASSQAWWPWKGPWAGEIDHGWRQGDPHQLADVKKLGELSDAGAPPQERVFGAAGLLRPNFIQPYRCRNVLIEGVTVVNSPMWVLHPVLCENVTVRGVTVRSHGPNNDGCNPESCRNVLIEDCAFDTGDDCVAVKSGRNADGRRLAVPSENIVVRGCRMQDGHGGVTLGSEMSGGIRNVFVENCFMSSPRLDRAIRLKSNSLRGGFLENLFVRNVRVGEVSDAVIHVDLRYDDQTGKHHPVVRNLFIDRVTAEKCKRPLYLLGIDEQPIQNVVVEDSRFENAAKPNVIEYVDRLILKNVTQPE
jgi:polygalacturonase